MQNYITNKNSKLIDLKTGEILNIKKGTVFRANRRGNKLFLSPQIYINLEDADIYIPPASPMYYSDADTDSNYQIQKISSNKKLLLEYSAFIFGITIGYQFFKRFKEKTLFSYIIFASIPFLTTFAVREYINKNN